MRKPRSQAKKNAKPGKLSYTLPSRYYTDAAVFEEEKGKIFYRTWQYLAHVNQAKNPGDYITRRIIDQEVLVVRDSDGRLRAFFNACQHRGHRLLTGEGTCKNIVCPYHAWVYRLDGSLKAARHTERVSGFDLSAIHLQEVALEEFCGFIFVNLKGAKPSLRSLTGDLEAEVRDYIPYLGSLQFVDETRVEQDCNWKVTIENYNECYHCAVVHKAFVTQVVTLDAYRVVPDGITLRHYSDGHKKEVAMYRYDPNHGGKGAKYATWFIWPNVAISCFPGGIVSMRHFRPQEQRRTEYAYQWFRDPGTPEEDVRDLMKKHAETNGAEDLAIVNSVQFGLESLGYDRGPLVVASAFPNKDEAGVAHIKSLYTKALGIRA